MFGRSSKWTSILFLVLCVVVLTTGCFGGGGGSGTTAKTVTTAAGGGTGGGKAVTNWATATFDGAPDEFLAALRNRPIVILFYIPGNADDTAVLDSVNRLKTSFDSYTFLIYNYKDVGAYGTLSQDLGVDYTPYLALVDGAGMLQTQFVGYVDEGTLNQSLVNLGR